MKTEESEEMVDGSALKGGGSDKNSSGNGPDELRILEALLFASDELMTAGHLKTILPGQPDARKIRSMVEKINAQLQRERHPFEVVEIGGGYQFRTITYYHPWVRQIFKEKAAKKLSIQALESLAIIAYKQPVSKADIEAIRGVVSDGAMKTLLEKRLITITGRSEKPGRPLLYGTTQVFLKYFGLNKLDELPRIEEFEAMAREKMEELSVEELSTQGSQDEEGTFDGESVEMVASTEKSHRSSTAALAEPFGEAIRTDDEAEAEIDIDVSLLSDKQPEPDNLAIGSKENEAVLDSAALRGETAFDLDAIIIEDPVIKMPHNMADSSAAAPQELSADEATFEIMESATVERKPIAPDKAEGSVAENRSPVSVDDDQGDLPSAPDTVFFEVGDGALDASDRTLSEDLKETVVISPIDDVDGPSSNRSKTASDSRETKDREEKPDIAGQNWAERVD